MAVDRLLVDLMAVVEGIVVNCMTMVDTELVASIVAADKMLIGLVDWDTVPSKWIEINPFYYFL